MDRDDAIDLGIARFVDNTHGAPSQLGQDLVSPKTFAPAIIHRCYLLFRVSELRAPSSARRPFRLVARRGSDQHADYVLVQHI